MVVEGVEERAGESWQTGAVVVSWNHALRRPGDPSGGHNVILHEFAHQLDQENGPVDGAPELPHTSMYATWARVLGREYQNLIAEVLAGYPTLIDQYGATNPAEFFAVVTEHFFEQPQQLKDRHPELYETLKSFSRQEPGCQWIANGVTNDFGVHHNQSGSGILLAWCFAVGDHATSLCH